MRTSYLLVFQCECYLLYILVKTPCFQNSLLRSVFSDEFPVPKSASVSGFIPRAPTGSDWSSSRTARGSDTELLQDVLQDLDHRAGYVGLVCNPY